MAAPPPPMFTLVRDQPYGPWNCDICDEQFHNNLSVSGDEQRPWKTPDGLLVCAKFCIKPLFEKALKFDFEYPYKWGNIELNIDEFAVLWPDGVFPLAYKAKGIQLKRDLQKAAQNPEFTPQNLGLVVGKDAQPCPKCHVLWALKDGCNHLICKSCETNYCFICGKEALPHSGHWLDPKYGGSCPRYNGAGDDNAIYDGAEDIEEWGSEISIETWAWNVTMRNASEAVQILMQRMLGVPMPADRQGALSDMDRRLLISRLLQYRPEHGVSREAWADVVAEHRHEVVALMNGGFLFFEPENVDRLPIMRGALAHPIGGVFNLSSETARRDAYQWAQERYNVWTPTTAGHLMNYAILDVGPGTPEDREDAAELLDILSITGEEATGGQIEFTTIESPFGQFMLAQVTGRGLELEDRFPGHPHPRRENPLSNLMFEFIRPQGARERTQREELRQDMGIFREGPQLQQGPADLDLDHAILADARINPVPRANRTIQNIVQNWDQEDDPEEVPAHLANHVDNGLEDRLTIERLTILRLRAHEEMEQEADRVDQRSREMFQTRRDAVQTAHAQDETITGWDFAPARAGVNGRGLRRSPFAEQSLEPWVQPWDELTRSMEPRSRAPQNTPEGSPTARRGDEGGL